MNTNDRGGKVGQLAGPARSTVAHKSYSGQDGVMRLGKGLSKGAFPGRNRPVFVRGEEATTPLPDARHLYPRARFVHGSEP
jgi:hypothetical protein